MSDRNNIPQQGGTVRRNPGSPSIGGSKPAVPPAPQKPSSRHASIKSKLPSWGSYKTWIEKIRGDWEDKK